MGVEAAIIGGSLISGYGAYKGAKQQAASMSEAIQAQREAAARVAEASKFRAVGVTSPYGQANIQVSPEGQLQSVGFELSPEEQQRAALFGQLGETALSGLTADPMEQARRQVSQIEALRAPERALAQERLFSNLAGKGLLGIGVDTGVGTNVNPYLSALQEAQNRESMLTALEAEQSARARQVEDYNLAQTYLGAQRGVFDIGTKELQRALNVSDLERQRAMGAAQTQYGYAQDIGQMTQNLGALRGQTTAAMFGGLGSAISGLGMQKMQQQYLQGTQTAPYQSTQQAFAVPGYRPNIQGTVTQGAFTPGVPYVTYP